jgi:hypothetical protein
MTPGNQGRSTQPDADTFTVPDPLAQRMNSV